MIYLLTTCGDLIICHARNMIVNNNKYSSIIINIEEDFFWKQNLSIFRYYCQAKTTRPATINPSFQLMNARCQF